MSFHTGKTGLQFSRIWHLVDAKDKVLGRLAQRIAIALRGKYKPFFNPAVDHGDYVVVTNSRHIALSGNKATQKLYRWHTQYPGGLQEIKYKDFLVKHPTTPLEKAVYGMLPKNNLRKVWMSRLKVFPDEDHPYADNILRKHDQESRERIAAELKNKDGQQEV